MSEADTELARYGVAWNGPTNPICQEMNDGLWTPWRVAHAEIARLRAERDALAKDAARYRWGVEHARWIRHEHEAYVAIPVAVDADLSCSALRAAAIDAALAEEARTRSKT